MPSYRPKIPIAIMISDPSQRGMFRFPIYRTVRMFEGRPVFRKIRYLALEGMKRKTNTRAYIQEIADLEKTGRDSRQPI
jgi:hypothetical protein